MKTRQKQTTNEKIKQNTNTNKQTEKKTKIINRVFCVIFKVGANVLECWDLK